MKVIRHNCAGVLITVPLIVIDYPPICLVNSACDCLLACLLVCLLLTTPRSLSGHNIHYFGATILENRFVIILRGHQKQTSQTTRERGEKTEAQHKKTERGKKQK